MDPIHIVWFKRDLRTADHRPLAQAAQRGLVLPLYIIEPSLHAAEDYSPRHWAFTRECLLSLRNHLADLGAPLVVRWGEAVAVLEAFRTEYPIAALWAHQETGNAFTYARDCAVIAWARANGIPFHEAPSGGVVRRLKNRDTWTQEWEARMAAPLTPAPVAIRPVAGVDPGEIPPAPPLPHNTEIQPGGEDAARQVLHSFLHTRGHSYHRQMSSPVTAFAACSRLSVHLAYGTLSMRQVVSAFRARRKSIYAMPQAEYRALDGSWKTAFKAFNSRLHWRDHFIQKLEDEPEIEFHSFVRTYDGLRPPNPAHLAAYKAGETGYPMVDACLRALRATGYLNFRMRALVTSFASYDLWLPWRDTGLHLAHMFTDYEPGIHWSQLQMQSGVTGINTVRIYNPTKQGLDHDPNGVFIRRWLPQLADVPLAYLHEPWKMPAHAQRTAGCIIGTHYPAPLVDHKRASDYAKKAIYAVRREPGVRAQIDAVLQKHGSRKRQNPRPTPRAKQPNPHQPQLL